MGMVFGKIMVETTKYNVLKKTPDYEIRRYAPSVVAQVTYSPSDFKGDKDGGFGVLVDYIGFFTQPKNTKSEQIAMTTPVVTKHSDSTGEKIGMTTPVVTKRTVSTGEKIGMTTPVVTKRSVSSTGEKIGMTTPVVTTNEKNETVTMQFMLPEKYKSVIEAPTPTDDRVVVIEECEKDYGVVTFSGSATDRLVEEKARELKKWLTRDGVKVVGEFSLARYNPPWRTLPAFRTNEVKYPVEFNV